MSESEHEEPSHLIFNKFTDDMSKVPSRLSGNNYQEKLYDALSMYTKEAIVERSKKQSTMRMGDQAAESD